MKLFKKADQFNNAQKAVGALIGVLVCVNILPALAMASKSNPAIPAVVSLLAQVFFVMFVYFALTWIRKD